MTLITILNHFISYLSKFINSPAPTQETITFPEMIKVPYVSERVFYVWKHIVYPWVCHTNGPIKFPELLADGHERQTSSSWIVPSVLATEVTPLLFLKRNSANFVKNAEVHGERGLNATSGGRSRWRFSLPFWSALSSGSVFSYWSTGAWCWGVNRFNCLANKDIFAVELLGLIASDTRTHTPGLRRRGQYSCKYLTHARMIHSLVRS